MFCIVFRLNGSLLEMYQKFSGMSLSSSINMLWKMMQHLPILSRVTSNDKTLLKHTQSSLNIFLSTLNVLRSGTSCCLEDVVLSSQMWSMDDICHLQGSSYHVITVDNIVSVAKSPREPSWEWLFQNYQRLLPPLWMKSRQRTSPLTSSSTLYNIPCWI